MADVDLQHLRDSPIAAVFHWPLTFCGGLTAATYVLSVLTGNLSQVDRIWSFAPTFYTAYFALLPLWPKEPLGWFYPYTPSNTLPSHMTQSYSPRALMMLGLQVLWTVRLSYNTHRRGLFALAEEDYRWAIIRRRVPKPLFQLFNFVVIAVYQNFLLFFFAIPTSIAAAQPHVPLGLSDYILGSLSVLALLFEFTADNQQFAFQTLKHEGKSDPRSRWFGAQLQITEADLKRGFLTKGLWAWSRHPNFMCEQTFWVLQNLIPLLSPQPPSIPLNVSSVTPFWLLAPALSILSLFISSTAITERISLGKYPEAYAAYQQRVAMFVPFLTPVWGWWLKMSGGKEGAEARIWGEPELKAKKSE